MKSKLIMPSIAFAAILAASPEGWALPPRQHSVSGVIAAIDYDAHTIAVAPTKGDRPLIFAWKGATRFSQGWSRVCIGTVELGQSVKVYYRREIGQLVPREVILRTETPVSCTTGGCCRSRRQFAASEHRRHP